MPVSVPLENLPHFRPNYAPLLPITYNDEHDIRNNHRWPCYIHRGRKIHRTIDQRCSEKSVASVAMSGATFFEPVASVSNVCHGPPLPPATKILCETDYGPSRSTRHLRETFCETSNFCRWRCEFSFRQKPLLVTETTLRRVTIFSSHIADRCKKIEMVGCRM